MQILLLSARVDTEADRRRYDGFAGDVLSVLSVPVRVCGRDHPIRYVDVCLVQGQLYAAGGSSKQASRLLGRCRKEPRTVGMARHNISNDSSERELLDDILCVEGRSEFRLDLCRQVLGDDVLNDDPTVSFDHRDQEIGGSFWIFGIIPSNRRA